MKTYFVRFFTVQFSLILLSVFGPRVSVADTRTDYLINMLQNSKNYRLRVQAATTLGKLRAEEAVPVLVKATKDSNDLVIISAAIALKQIGDASVVPELEKSMAAAPSDAAKSQLALTLKILSEIGRIKTPSTVPLEKPRFLVRVDAMGNATSVGGDLPAIMRRIVVERLEKERDVLMQPADWTPGTVNGKVKKEKLKAYIISGAVIRAEKVDQNLVVKLSLNVFTNPDYSLIMMPTSEATLEMRPSAGKPEDDMPTVSQAVNAIADSLITSIFDNLRQGAPE